MKGRRFRERRRLIAYHEVGHAVAARKLGIEINNITMIADDDKLANVRTRSAAWVAEQAGGDRVALVRGLYADLMVVLAGLAAQKLAGYPGDTDGLDGDTERMIDLASALARIEAGLPMRPDPDEPQELKPGDPLHTAGIALIERAWAETTTMLQDNWLAVERAAGAQRKRDQLTQADLDHVIAQGQRGFLKARSFLKGLCLVADHGFDDNDGGRSKSQSFQLVCYAKRCPRGACAPMCMLATGLIVAPAFKDSGLVAGFCVSP